MSELTTCNYCNYQNLKARAKKEGKELIKKAKPFGSWGGGVDLHIVKKGGKPTEKNCVGWFAQLPWSCCC